MADAQGTAQQKQLVKDGAEAKAKSVEDAKQATSGKPTPTQEENDLAKVGIPVETHEDDGSGPEPGNPATKKHAEAGKPGAYQTRASTPTPPKQPQS